MVRCSVVGGGVSIFSTLGNIQKVSCLLPFAFDINKVLSLNHQLSFPDALSRSAVSEETWIRPGSPVLSILDAVFMVSPNSWNLAFDPFRTPAVTLYETSKWTCHERVVL